MLFFAEILAKYSQNLPFWSKYNADSQIETKPGPTDELLQTKPIGLKCPVHSKIQRLPLPNSKLRDPSHLNT